MPTIDGKHLPYTKANVSKAKRAKKAGKKVKINLGEVARQMYK